MTDETTQSSLKDAGTVKGRKGAGIDPGEVGDASSKPSASPSTSEAKEAIDRATAAIGEDEG